MLLIKYITSKYAKYWGKKIKSYINTVKECLLKYDIKKDNKVKCLRAISHHQEKVEKMALEFNAKMSTMMGTWLTFMIGFLMLSLVTIGVLQTVSENGSKTGEIVGLSIFTLLWGGMFVYVLWDATQINKVWETQRKIVLNDSILQIQIEALFGQRFNEWMRNHEVAAARVWSSNNVSTIVGGWIDCLLAINHCRILYCTGGIEEDINLVGVEGINQFILIKKSG